MTTATVPHFTAHDRLKDSFWSYVWGATIFSALVHFAVLAWVRIDNVPDYSYTANSFQQIELQQEDATYEIPPPPERISRPAVPVMSTDMFISSDITIGEVAFDDFKLDAPPPPPTNTMAEVDRSEQPAFTPYEVRPKLLNGKEIQEKLVEFYPSMYKDAGFGGITTLWIYIDEGGVVRNTKVVESSGFEAFDQLAQKIFSENAKFSPAINMDNKVPVWIQMPVTFEARMGKLAG